jgi:hypothetical protein
MSVSEVTFNEDLLVVTVDTTAPPEVVIEPAVVVVEIAATGLQGGTGPAGDPGVPGPPGPKGDPGDVTVTGNVYYKHDQMVASDVWLIVHNLGYHPNVAVQDSGGTSWETEIEYIDLNSLYSRSSFAFAGTAYCT